MQTVTTAITTTATVEVSKEAAPVVKKQFLRYIHSFRGIAIIFVVAGHVLLRWADDSKTHTFFRTFWENGTVLFVFMAGYLFQHLSRKYEYKDYLTKKFLNVILPYLVVSTPIIVMRLIQHDYPGVLLDLHPDFDSWSTLSKISYFIFHGAHLQQLWFVPMITIVYFLAPALIYIDRHPRLYWILLLLVPVSLVVPREPFIDIPRMFAHLISVYVFGMLMSHYKDAYLDWAKKYWLPLTLITMAAFAVNLYYFDQFNGPLNYVHKMLFCLCFIYWLWKLDKYVPPVIGLLAELSFGIFFVHYYVLLGIRAVYAKTIGGQVPGNILTWVVSLLIGLGVSVLIIKMVQKLVPKYSKNLIGV
jgi:Predicted acyltransferases